MNAKILPKGGFTEDEMGNDPVKLHTFLNYGGNCAQAFRFYEQHLGGKITMMMTHAQRPNSNDVPLDRKNAILHARIEIGGT